jgi:hypothetical protein
MATGVIAGGYRSEGTYESALRRISAVHHPQQPARQEFNPALFSIADRGAMASY